MSTRIAPLRPLRRPIDWPMLVCLATIGGGCSLESPKAPQFETSVHLPLGTRTTTGRDLLEDSAYVEGDSAGNEPLSFVLEGTIEPVEVGDFLEFATPLSRFEAELGEISVSAPSARTVEFRLRSLSSLFGSLPEGASEMVVPPFVIPPQSTPIAPLEGISWAHLSRGLLRVRVRNELPLPLAAQEGDAALEVRLLNRADGTPLFAVRVDDAISPGQTRSFEADLAGRTMTSDLVLEVRGGSAGSSGAPVEVRPDEQRLTFDASIQELAADSVQAVLPSQSFRFVDSVRVAEDVGWVEGEILSGSIPVAIENRLPLVAAATLALPEVQRVDGTPLALTVELPAGSAGLPSRTDTTLDLTGTRIVSPDGRPRRALSWELIVVTSGSDGSVRVGSGQGVAVEFAAGLLAFERLEGTMEGRRFDLPATETLIDPPEGIDELRFERAGLVLSLESSVGLAASATLSLAGLSADGSLPVVLPLHLSLEPPASPGEIRTTRFTWDESNSAILDLIAAHPRRLRLEGALRVGAEGVVGTVSREDVLRGSYRLQAPLRMRIGRVRHRSEPFRIELEDDVVDRIRENVVSAEAVGTVRNHLPAALTAHLRFGVTEADLELDPGTHPARVIELDSLHVAPGAVDPTSGRVRETVASEVAISIRPEQVPFFARREWFGQIVLVVEGSADQVVEVTAADFVAVNAMLSFRTRVKR